jgi:hypothetical protein
LYNGGSTLSRTRLNPIAARLALSVITAPKGAARLLSPARVFDL